jgi:catechol 2,3-dioxygenase-like lactoylglutathione lyase family enzyme
MFSHITVGTFNLQDAATFYDAVLQPIGLVRRQVVTSDGGVESVCWVSPDSQLPRFYVYMPFNRQPASVGNGSMVAFQAPSEAAVDAAYLAGLSAGGTDEGKPGERRHYGDGYYGAYLRDPDGNKVHVVYRGDLAMKDVTEVAKSANTGANARSFPQP